MMYVVLGLQALSAVIIFVIIVFLIIRRRKIKKTESFEDRSN